MPANPSRQRYPVAGPETSITWHDLLIILDSHGFVLGDTGKGQRSPDAKIVRRLFKSWVEAQGLDARWSYVMPLRVLTETISESRPELIRKPTGGVSWAVLVNALNDPHSGLTVVRRRYCGATAA